jgi:peroxiredoxin
MKKFLYLIVIVALVSACTTKPKYVVTGKIQGADSGMVILQQRVSGSVINIDSAKISGGNFKLEGVVNYPQMANFAIKGIRGGKMFFLENAEINIIGNKDSLYLASVTGSASQSEYEAYVAMFDDLNQQMDVAYGSFMQARGTGNQVLADSIEKVLDSIDKKMLAMNKEYIAAHPSSYVTPIVLGDIAYYIDATEMETMLNSLDTTLNKVTNITKMKERLKMMKAVAIGQKAPDFTLNDINGNMVTLSSKFDGKTKLLLIDFWASWCGPCRGENPNVVKVWKEFNKKGFDVFGVSLDQDGEAWKKAIADDKLTWTQVSDLKYWNCAPAQLYAVSAIPSNFLLDGNGIILANNLRGEDLYNKVKEILGDKK